MSDPQPPSEPSPTLEPIQPTEQPPGRQDAPPPIRAVPPQAGYLPVRAHRPTSALKIVLLVLGALALVGSIGLNMVLLTEVGAEFQHGAAMKTAVLQGGKASQTIALYGVEGLIDSRATNEFRHFFRSVAEDGNVKAVVLRVNSPGGGVTSSDQICEMVKGLKAGGKKVVVSMGSLAASGAYYISAPADEIYAEATTVTGSIGVIAGWVVLKGTLDKIGAEPVIIKSSHAHGWKDEMSSFSMPHDYQRRHIQDVLDKMQERFEEVVMAGRGSRLKCRQVSYTIPADKEGAQPTQHTETEPLNGKIYLADKARDLGLIDQIGYQDAAVRRAAQLAGLTDERVVRYSRRRSFVEALLEGKESGSLRLDLDLLEKLQTPRFLMLWKVE